MRRAVAGCARAVAGVGAGRRGISGDNGQGNTHRVEAIFVVAALRSFRTAKLFAS